MSELQQGGNGVSDEVFDRDINVKAIVWTGLALALLCAVAIILMWIFAAGLRDSEVARDPEPSPLEEARVLTLPPGPRLQGAPGSEFEGRSGAPELELRALREAEQRTLTTYGWVSEEAGTARIPITRAMEILAADMPAVPVPVGEVMTPEEATNETPR